MRKYTALVMVALLSLTLAIAAVGCGKKADDASSTTTTTTTTTTETTAPSDSTMGGGMDSTAMHSDTTMNK